MKTICVHRCSKTVVKKKKIAVRQACFLLLSALIFLFLLHAMTLRRMAIILYATFNSDLLSLPPSLLPASISSALQSYLSHSFINCDWCGINVKCKCWRGFYVYFIPFSRRKVTQLSMKGNFPILIRWNIFLLSTDCSYFWALRLAKKSETVFFLPLSAQNKRTLVHEFEHRKERGRWASE